MSKRRGDVAVDEYRANGYLKEALVNFVALLGWNPGTPQEFFSLEELTEQFSLERVNKAGAIFNLDKLMWLNFEHLRKKPDNEVLSMLEDELARSCLDNRRFDDAYLLKVISAMRERVSFVRDFITQSPYFFEAPSRYEEQAVRKRWKQETCQHLRSLADAFSGLREPRKEDFEATLHATAKSLEVENAELIHAVRLAISGVSGGPGVYDILQILGKDESVKRIHAAIDIIKSPSINCK